MLFKIFVTFVWFVETAFVFFCTLGIAHLQLDMISKIFLYIVCIFAETYVSVLFIEGMNI